MNKTNNRKSSLFTSLKSRRSLKDLKALKSSPSFSSNLKSQLVDSTPLAPVEINTMSKRKSFISIKPQVKPLHKTAMALSPVAPSPVSELTFTTSTNSDMGTPETVSMHSTSVTLATQSKQPVAELDEDAPSGLLDDFSHYLSFEQSYGATRLPRTPNLETIRRMVEDETIIPMNNRRSLDFEAQQLEELHEKLGAEDVAVRLVENAFFMSFYSLKADERARAWDAIDTDEVLKGDSELGLVQ